MSAGRRCGALHLCASAASAAAGPLVPAAAGTVVETLNDDVQSLTVQADDARADHDANLMASAVARQAAAASAARLSGIESRLKLCAKREEGRRAQAATPITAGSNDAEGWQPSADEGQEGPVPLSPPRLLASRSSVVVVVWASGFNCSGDATGHAMGAVRVSATGSGVGGRVGRMGGGGLSGHASPQGSWRATGRSRSGLVAHGQRGSSCVGRDSGCCARAQAAAGTAAPAQPHRRGEAQAEPEVRYRREASMPVSLYSVYVLIVFVISI